MNTNVDQLYMIRALKLATYGQGLVEPNPMVGCVIAHEDYSSENALVEDESHESHIVEKVGIRNMAKRMRRLTR